ncbi:TonB-dependent receptor [Flavobacteriaceae bacterium]|nr:TonB-dependent receptor [Flavobacteriaceae bacterium]MDC3297416.1 TonB-dependent receptor [Flavobacteriaceae bacterium]
MKTKIRISLLAIMLFAFQPIFSQVNEDLVELDEVVLTLPFGQTLGKSVLKVDKLNFNDINPIIKQYISNSISKLPGVSIISTGAGIGKPSIRGLSFNRVVVLNQGMRLENQQWGEEHGLALSSSGVNSVEVVKGPLYVLYGSDAMGGVLYIEPEKYLTSDDLEIDYTGIYNSNYSGFSNNLGLKGSSENFSYMLRADITDNGNYSSPDGEIENTWFKQNDFKAGVAYQTEKFQSDLRFSMSETEVGIPHMEEGHDDHDDHDDHEEDGHDDHDDHGEEDHYQEINHTTLTWKNTFDMGNDHTLDITLGRQLNERKEFGGHEEEGHEDHEDHEEEGHDDHDDHEGHEEGEAELDMELETTSIDIKLTMPQSDDLNLIIGTSLLNQENKNFGHETLIPDAEKKDFGLFALGQFDIDDTSQALIGVRYDNRSISSESSSNDYSNFNGSLGFKKDFGNSTLRINLSSGFRAPDLIELYADGSHHGSFQYKKGNTNLEAEESLQTDLSYQINNDNSIVSFDLFYNDISDYIYLNPSSMFEDGLRVYDYMQQDSKLYGGEIHLNKNTSIDWLSYYTSIEYVFAESMDGEALPFISPLTLNQVFNIDFGNNYSVEIDFIAKAKQSRVSMFEEETDGYSVLNLSGNYKTEFMTNDLNLFWRISNVFDKEYYDHLSRLKTAGIEEMGRNISVGLKYNF